MPRQSLPPGTLAEMHAGHTRQRILDAALEILVERSVAELTVREAAKRARLSERTVFRYFATHDDFFDAIAVEVGSNLRLPPAPQSLDELFALPRALYGAFEANAKMVEAALHSEIFPRLRDAQARQRWLAVRKLVDGYATRAPERSRKIAATNIRFPLSASSWHYYRFYFGFTLEETIACAETAIRDALDGVRRAAGVRKRASGG